MVGSPQLEVIPEFIKGKPGASPTAVLKLSTAVAPLVDVATG